MSVEMIIAIATAITAIMSMVITVISTVLQQRHNRNSVLPILDFPCCCSSTTMSVKIKNAGTGPMIVKSLTVTMDGKERDSMLSCFDKEDLDYIEPYYFSNYGHILQDGRAFTPNQEFPLLYLNLREGVDLNELRCNADFCQVLNKIVDTFRKIRIEVKYQDVYKGKFTRTIELSPRFSRHKDIMQSDVQNTPCSE